MAFKVTVFLACVISVTIALPVEKDVGRYLYSEHKLSGASGTFRYPLSGSAYQNHERVIITAGFPEDTVFILENYTTESEYDTINIHKWVGDNLVLDTTYSGTSTGAKYFLPEGNFLITFNSDSVVTKSGFNFRWAPLETLFLQ